MRNDSGAAQRKHCELQRQTDSQVAWEQRLHCSQTWLYTTVSSVAVRYCFNSFQYSILHCHIQ